MRRGEVWWADLGPDAGRRPVEVALGPEDGLPRQCVANLDTITTIAQTDLRERITDLVPAKVREVEAAIHFALGLTW